MHCLPIFALSSFHGITYPIFVSMAAFVSWMNSFILVYLSCRHFFSLSIISISFYSSKHLTNFLSSTYLSPHSISETIASVQSASRPIQSTIRSHRSFLTISGKQHRKALLKSLGLDVPVYNYLHQDIYFVFVIGKWLADHSLCS